MQIIALWKGIPNIMYLVWRITRKLKRQKKLYKDIARSIRKGIQKFEFELSLH